MATSPLRSPSGEPPQSPQSFHSPLQSPTHEPPASSGNLSSIPPSPFLNNNNNNDHNNNNSSNNKVNSVPRSPAHETLSSPVMRSPSRGAVNNNHSNTPSSPLGNRNGTVNSPMIRSPVTQPNHLSVPQSPSHNNSKESPSNTRPILSPKLGPMPERSYKQSIHTQPPYLNALTESEPSPSPNSRAMISGPITDGGGKLAMKFNEEAMESPLSMDLDRSDGPGRVTGSGGRGYTVVADAVWRAEMRHAAIFLRVLAAVLCLVSFSVMAADRTTGWDGDWYQRYAEYRFVLTVNVMTFVYSCFQLFTEIYRVVTTKHLISRPLSYYIDLFMDQVLAYLLMSASSVAASHNDIWVSRFGGDEFTRKINGSVAISFLAFVALALSSVISTYIVFRWLA